MKIGAQEDQCASELRKRNSGLVQINKQKREKTTQKGEIERMGVNGTYLWNL